MPPMVTKYADSEGMVTERMIDYYEERAQGGVGLIIVEAAYIDPKGRIFETQLGISNDRHIPGLRNLVNAIHKHGAKAALQIHHGGRQANPELPGVSLLAPSALLGAAGQVSKELTIHEIKEIVRAFAVAAKRAETAGFDGVEIHGATHYLIAQFLSGFTNKRQDSYGGNPKNRARILVEIIEKIKEMTSSDLTVWCRINGKEYGIENGITLEEAKTISKIAQDGGSDAIHVSAFGPVSPLFGPPSPLQEGAFPLIPGNNVPLAAEIKKIVSVPVITVGGIPPEAGETILEDGKADFVAIGRGLLADPQLPNKLLSRQVDDIRPCILCMQCREELFLSGDGIHCSVNPSLGSEKKYQIKPVQRKRKILVAGGGPAGLESARVAALRGHEVILYERENNLGGQLLPAAQPPTKSKIKDLIRYFENQMKNLGIRIELGKVLNREVVSKINPEVLIIAAGSIPFTPQIKGIEETNVAHAVDVLKGNISLGEKVFIVGGERVGCETAEFIAGKGKKVTLARRREGLVLSFSSRAREQLLARLEKKGVTVRTGIQYEMISSQGVVIKTREGKEELIEADLIVLAAGSRPDQSLLDEIKGMPLEIHLAGDCVQPRSIQGAISEGFQIACLI